MSRSTIRQRTSRGALALAVALTGVLLASTGAADAATGRARAGTSPAISTDTSASDTTVLRDWNLRAQSLAITLRPTAHGQGRGMAMVQGAVYDAVNAIDRGRAPYRVDVDVVDAPAWASVDAAIATAAHHVLRAITPVERWADLDLALATTLAGVPDGAAETQGIHAGSAAAAAMIDSRVGDGFRSPFTFDIGDQPGNWRPETSAAVDPDPWVGNLRPFLMTAPDQFPSRGPNALTSAEYTKEFNEVKELGSLTSTTRTPDQTMAAIFWQSPPVATYNTLARSLVIERAVSTADAARLLAQVNLAAADGSIACWNDKYRWSFWRPTSAIREADTDGNPATIADPAWRSVFDPATQTSPALSTPPFPDHPSGHGCGTGAAIHTFMSFFGTDKVPVWVTSVRFPAQPRYFDRLSLVLKEVIDARVWGGIHFRTADVQGAVIGKKIVRWMDRHYFGPAS